MPHDSPPHPSSIHVDDFGDASEEVLLDALSTLGQEAFEEVGEDRVYVCPELARSGKNRALLAAVAAGWQAWSRDTVFDSAADILVSRGDEATLLSLLAAAPPRGPWADRSLSKLWLSCAQNGLIEAMTALAHLAPPPEEVWRQAAECWARPYLVPVLLRAAPHCKDLHPSVLLHLAGGGSLCLPHLLAVLARPDFDPKLFDSPWAAACDPGSEPTLAALVDARAPRSGWRQYRELDDPFSALSRRSRGAPDQEVYCAHLLAQHGFAPSSEHLADALRADPPKTALADAMEKAGALPDVLCGQLCVLKSPAGSCSLSDAPRADDRLARWLRAGSIDILDPPRPGHIAWTRLSLERWSAQPVSSKPAARDDFLLALARSPSWSDPAARARMIGPLANFDIHRLCRELAITLGADPGIRRLRYVEQAVTLFGVFQAAIDSIALREELDASPASPAPHRPALKARL